MARLAVAQADVVPAVAVGRAKEWLRQTQNADGSWGFYGRPTAEETAYGVLGLATGAANEVGERDRRRCAAALRYLRFAPTSVNPADCPLPPLWIDKCLYTPTLVVRAVIEAAFVDVARLAGQRRAKHPRRRRRRGLADHRRNE